MHWFRSRSRSAAQLALFALLFQMAVSFGHLHRDDLGLPPLAIAGEAQIGSPDRHFAAGDQDHQSVPDDYCPICASMALIATAIPSLPPVVIPPIPVSRSWRPAAPAQIAHAQVALSFRARAPPIA
jgi:hypothetical protein